MHIHRVADSGYGTVDLFTVNDSGGIRNRSNSAGTTPARLRAADTHDQPTQAVAASPGRDDALLAIPSQENLDNVVSNQLEDLSTGDELNLVNETSSYNEVLGTPTDQLPGLSSEVVLPTGQENSVSRYCSTDSGTSQEDNTVLQVSMAPFENANLSSQNGLEAKADIYNCPKSQDLEHGLTDGPRALESNPSEMAQHHEVCKSNDLSRDTFNGASYSPPRNDSSDEPNLNVYSLNCDHRQVPVGNSNPVAHPSLTPLSLNSAKTNNNLYTAPVANNLLDDNDLQLSDYNNTFDSIVAEKQGFKLHSHSSVDVVDDVESLDRDLEAPQPLAASLQQNLDSARPKERTPYRNDVNLIGPDEPVPPRHQSYPSQSNPCSLKSNVDTSKPDPLTQHPPYNRTQDPRHMPPPRYPCPPHYQPQYPQQFEQPIYASFPGYPNPQIHQQPVWYPQPGSYLNGYWPGYAQPPPQPTPQVSQVCLYCATEKFNFLDKGVLFYWFDVFR